MAESDAPRVAADASSSASRIAPQAGFRPASAPEWLIRFTHAWFDRLAAIVLPIFYPCITVHGAGRFPRRGAVLVFSNHPSTWADGVLMTVALKRPVRFLVHAPLYHPRVRGWLLRSYGALPMYHRDDTPAAIAKNEETTRACHAAFDRGEAVATFPEGVSSTDWRMRPFKSGAARMALDYASGRARGRPLTLIPVGVYYRDRTAFRSDVEISVGEPIPIVPDDTLPDEPRAQAEALTARMFGAMAGLVVNAADPETEALARAMLPIVLPERRVARASDVAVRQPARSLECARALVRALERLRADAPERRAELEAGMIRYCDARDRLRLTDDELGRPERAEPAFQQAGWLLLTLVVAPLALAGWALHWFPAALTKLAVRRYAGEPSRVGFGRVVAGFALFPCLYAIGGLLLWRILGLPAVQVALILAAAALLGFASLSSRSWIKRSLRGVRLRWLESRTPDRVRWARQARAALLALLAAERPGGATAARVDAPAGVRTEGAA
jgi:1-acyl-sn-glycerol-3-phosphate acyltransferase